MITQNIAPKIIHPVYNDQRVVLDSSNLAEQRFRYLTDIKDEFGNTLGLLRTPPRPNGFGIIEIDNILKDYVQYELNPFVISQGPNGHFLKYDLEYGEEYVKVWEWDGQFFAPGGNFGITTDSSIVTGGSDEPHDYQQGDLIVIDTDPLSPLQPGKWRVVNVISPLSVEINQVHQSSPFFPGTSFPADLRTTQYKDLVRIQNRVVFNGALTFDTHANFVPQQWQLNFDNQTANLITTTPQDIEVDITDYFTANYFVNSLINPDTVRINVFKPSGLENLVIPNTYGTVGIGPANLNQWLVNPILPGEIYTIRLINLDKIFCQSVSYTFKVSKLCSKFENKKLIWLDRQGGWKSFNFELHSVKNITSNKTVFERNNIGDYDPISNSYTIKTQEFGDRIEHSRFNESYTVNSDRLSQNQIELVEDLFTSRFVYEYVPGAAPDLDKYIPVILTSNDYAKEDLLHRRRKLLSVTYRHSNKNHNN